MSHLRYCKQEIGHTECSISHFSWAELIWVLLLAAALVSPVIFDVQHEISEMYDRHGVIAVVGVSAALLLIILKSASCVSNMCTYTIISITNEQLLIDHITAGVTHKREQYDMSKVTSLQIHETATPDDVLLVTLNSLRKYRGYLSICYLGSTVVLACNMPIPELNILYNSLLSTGQFVSCGSVYRDLLE